MKIVELQSGSSGNCSFLYFDSLHQLILFDLGLSFKRLNELINEHNIDLKSDELDVLVLISHSHKDHWVQTTWKQLEKQENLTLKLVFPRLLDGNDWKEDHAWFAWNSHLIGAWPLKHGDTETFFYIVDEYYGYLTDVESSQIFNILLIPEAYKLKYLELEANYDISWHDYKEQADIANGYSVASGFDRHLSKQEHDYIVSVLKPQEEYSIHHSSRFYKELDK